MFIVPSTTFKIPDRLYLITVVLVSEVMQKYHRTNMQQKILPGTHNQTPPRKHLLTVLA